MDITRGSTPKSDWLYWQPKMEKLCTVSKNKTRSWLWLRSWTPYCQIQTEIEWFYEDLHDLLELTYVLFIIGDWNAKVESQETPGVTGKFGLEVQKEAGQRLIEFCQENSVFIAHTLFQQHKRTLYTWTSPDGQHWNRIDYIFCGQRWRSSIQSAKTRLGTDCGKIMNSLLPNSDLNWTK